MKKIARLFALMAFGLFGYWIYSEQLAPTPKHLNDISVLVTPVAKLAIKKYQVDGLSGLKDISSKCYIDLQKKPNNLNFLRCMTIDMTAESIDSCMSRAVGFPTDDYFNSLSIDVRVNIAKDYFNTSQIIETKYLRILIKPLIDKELR